MAKYKQSITYQLRSFLIAFVIAKRTFLKDANKIEENEQATNANILVRTKSIAYLYSFGFMLFADF